MYMYICILDRFITVVYYVILRSETHGQKQTDVIWIFSKITKIILLIYAWESFLMPAVACSNVNIIFNNQNCLRTDGFLHNNNIVTSFIDYFVLSNACIIIAQFSIYWNYLKSFRETIGRICHFYVFHITIIVDEKNFKFLNI